MATIKQDDFIERRRRAAVHQLLPSGRLHQPRRGLRARGVARRQDAMAQILINSRMCAEGHRPICQDTGIVTSSSRSAWTCAGTARRCSVDDMVNEGVRRAYLRSGQQAARLDARRSRRRAQEHRATTRPRGPRGARARRQGRRDRRGEGRRLREQDRSSSCSTRPTRSSTGCSRPCRPWAPAGARRACSASASAAPPKRRCCWPRRR